MASSSSVGGFDSLCLVIMTMVIVAAASATTSFKVALRYPMCIDQGDGGSFSMMDVAPQVVLTPLSSTTTATTTAADAVLRIFYNDTTDENGWIALRITKDDDQQRQHNPSQCSQTVRDAAEWFAAGYAEGKLSQHKIWQMWINSMNPFNETGLSFLSANVTTWIDRQIAWIEHNVRRHEATDVFWRRVGLILAQLRGMASGYAAVAPQSEPLSYREMFYNNLDGELSDIVIAAEGTASSSIMRPFHRRGCSALIKVVDDDGDGDGDVMFAHTTWAGYNTMLRAVKDYNFSEDGGRVVMTSYPGYLTSTDDWFMLGSGLAVMETTIRVHNMTLYKQVTADGVSEWLRTMVANYLATNGSSWGQYFSMHSSGTYTNQFMIMDANTMKEKDHRHRNSNGKWMNIPDNFLWVVEQMPGVTHSADQSSVLRRTGYWASYNVPFYADIFTVSGFAAMQQRYGDLFSHEKTPRARIFAARQSGVSVNSLAMMKKLMRYNDWAHDPLSRCPGCSPIQSSPRLGIAERTDLVPENETTWGQWAPFLGGPYPSGAIDAKITSLRMMNNMNGDGLRLDAVVIAGPSSDQQPPFRWSTSPVSRMPLNCSSHVGQPDLQLFPWVNLSNMFP